MELVNCEDGSDSFKLECRSRIKRKRHKVELLIRASSWFEQSKMTLEEILKYSYRWCQELDQAHLIRHELGLATHTGCDWDSFCREICEISLMEESQSIGEEGKVVQIDESKFGKRKYHRGHHMLKGSGYSAEPRAIVENAFLSRWKKEMNRLYCPLSKSGLNLELR